MGEKKKSRFCNFLLGLWHWVCNFFRLFLNLKFLLSFGIAWMIVNGIWYIGLGIGVAYDIAWLTSVCGAYVAFLYFPFTAEKLVSVPLGIAFAKWFFPKDLKLQEKIKALLPKKKSK